MEHTKEPWDTKVTVDPETGLSTAKIIMADGEELPSCFGESEIYDYADRIVTCVNALAGIEDVEGFMSRVHGQIEAAMHHLNNEHDLDVLESLNEALALFPKDDGKA